MLFVVSEPERRALQEIENKRIRIIGDMPHLTTRKSFFVFSDANVVHVDL